MATKRALMLLGGWYHDFAGFAAHLGPLVEKAGYGVETCYAMEDLLRLPTAGVDLIVSYTSFLKHREGQHDTFPECLSDAQALALAEWVRAGGKLLGVHSATVRGAYANPAQKALLGAAFLEHPPQYSFTVYPLLPEHPITAGVEAFSVHDEFYIQAYASDLDVHMVAVDRGRAYPMVWSRREGQGRVAVIAMGHSEQVWDLPAYRQLIRQTVAWLEESD
ncbi:MAG: ThuA domain-containing protein [Anaerolineae bacterium]